MSDPQPWSDSAIAWRHASTGVVAAHSGAAIAEFITNTLPTDPHTVSKPLRFELKGWPVARRGGYRVTFRAFPDGHTL